MPLYSALNNPDVFGALGDSFQAQTRMAQLAGLQAAQQQEAQTRMLQEAAAQQQHPPNVGGFTTQVSASNVPEGIMKGVAAGMGNLGQVLQQRAMQKQQQQQLAQRIELAQRAEMDKQRREAVQVDLGNAAIATLNSPQASNEEKISAYQTMNALTGGQYAQDMAKQYGSQQVEAMGKVPLAKAAAEGEAAAYKIKSDAAAQAGPLEMNGVPQPGAINAYRGLMGFTPNTSLDVEKSMLSNKQATVDLQKSANELSVQPQILAQKIAGNELDMFAQQVENKYVEAEKKIDLLVGQSKLDEAKQLKERLATGRTFWQNAQAKYESMTPGEVKMFNSSMKGMELPFELPEKKDATEKPTKYQPIKNKLTGSVNSVFDPATGRTFKLDQNGNPIIK